MAQTIEKVRLETQATQTLRLKLPSIATVRLAADVAGREIWTTVMPGNTDGEWTVLLDVDKDHETAYQFSASYGDIDVALTAVGFWDVAFNGKSVILEGEL